MEGERLAIGGMKLSMPLVLFRWDAFDPEALESIFERLGAGRINLPVVWIDHSAAVSSARFCIDAAGSEQALPILQAFDDIRQIAPVVAISVYPFGKRLTLLGKILQAFAESNLPIHAVGSSLASIVVLGDDTRRAACVEALLRHLRLPENHAPFEPEFRVRYQERS